jgi:hypothetical protein
MAQGVGPEFKPQYHTHTHTLCIYYIYTVYILYTYIYTYLYSFYHLLCVVQDFVVTTSSKSFMLLTLTSFLQSYKKVCNVQPPSSSTLLKFIFYCFLPGRTDILFGREHDPEGEKHLDRGKRKCWQMLLAPSCGLQRGMEEGRERAPFGFPEHAPVSMFTLSSANVPGNLGWGQKPGVPGPGGAGSSYTFLPEVISKAPVLNSHLGLGGAGDCAFQLPGDALHAD